MENYLKERKYQPPPQDLATKGDSEIPHPREQTARRLGASF